ncbi:hypothetical protein [Mucilaginibacter pedocola]|uniref:Uncharacterized protein n=1 Tax=Mucilaginibacter pedocola TaxID=1792845 RepID=A0A1S9PD36_9SPHI|nr:hypothetical protein [Mucilaginibacter pedocola]OOQ58757.1 hypothetical protein BC343_08875 [Mucilaginibacter pedocola]
MKATTKHKNLRPLNAAELMETNGGSSQTGSASISMSSSADSLLSIQMEWQQGDHYRMYKVEAGKDIDFNLSAWGNGVSSNS